MPTTADQRTEIRQWIGSGPSDAAIDAVFDGAYAGSSTLKTALVLLRTAYADLALARPAKLGLPARYTDDWSANMAALKAQITALSAAVGEPVPGTVVTWGKLTRKPRGPNPFLAPVRNPEGVIVGESWPPVFP